MRRFAVVSVPLLLACAGLPGSGPGPAGDIALGGTPTQWDEVVQKGGKWVRWEPCGANAGSLTVDTQARTLAQDVGQEVITWQITSAVLVDDHVDFVLTMDGSPADPISLVQSDGGRSTITDSFGTRTYAPVVDRAKYPLTKETPCEF